MSFNHKQFIFITNILCHKPTTFSDQVFKENSLSSKNSNDDSSDYESYSETKNYKKIITCIN